MFYPFYAENKIGTFFAKEISMNCNSSILNGLAILAFLAVSAFSSPMSLYGSNLYTDKKGKKAGDVVTVLVLEAAKAGSDTRTETKKKNEIDIGQEKPTGSKLFSWLPSFGVNSNAKVNYDGQGTTARNGKLEAII